MIPLPLGMIARPGVTCELVNTIPAYAGQEREDPATRDGEQW